VLVSVKAIAIVKIIPLFPNTGFHANRHGIVPFGASISYGLPAAAPNFGDNSGFDVTSLSGHHFARNAALFLHSG
jgi:hypothetical protein